MDSPQVLEEETDWPEIIRRAIARAATLSPLTKIFFYLFNQYDFSSALRVTDKFSGFWPLVYNLLTKEGIVQFQI